MNINIHVSMVQTDFVHQTLLTATYFQSTAHLPVRFLS